MKDKPLVVSVSIFPPGEPGQSLRLSFAPEVHSSVLALEVGTAVAKAVRKARKPKEAPPA